MNTQKPTRSQLEAIFKDHRLVIAFENLFDDAVVGLPEAIAALAAYIASRGNAANLEGEQGEEGERGPQGQKGDQGERGLIGYGIDGNDGYDGERGPQGVPGKDGERGPVGYPGMDGEDCEQFQYPPPESNSTGSGILVRDKAPSVQDLTIRGTSGNIYSGTYTPTIVNGTNVASSTPQSYSKYIRVMNEVHFSIPVTIDPTAVGEIAFTVSLPVPSAFTNVREAVGTGTATVGSVGAITGMSSVVVFADTTGDTLQVYGYANDAAARSYQLVGSYQIV